MRYQQITSIQVEPFSSSTKLPSLDTMKRSLNGFTSNVILIFILTSQLTVLSHCSHITTMISTIVASTQSSHQSPANLNDNYSTDSSTFSRPALADNTLELAENSSRSSSNHAHERTNTENVSEVSPTTTIKPAGLSEYELSTGSISELIDDNYLAADPEVHDVSQPPEISVTKVEDISVSDINSLLMSKAHSVASKSKRQAYSFSEASDWWTKLSSKNFNTNKGSKSDTRGLEKPKSPSKVGKGGVQHSTTKTSSYGEPAYKRTVYKEQPLSQNAILTIRNQLAAIRGKHKILVTRSVRQLQQLDTKLIESYKLCLKKKMPLYAGMLYRTRDFVVRMAKDVKHEREVLEAMTRQVQNVLRQKMTNRTLVRDYNRLVSTTTETSPIEDFQRIAPVKIITTTKITTSMIRTKKDSSLQQIEDSTQQADSTVTEQSMPDSTFVPSNLSRSPTATGKKNWYGGRQKPSGQHHKGSPNSTADSSSSIKSTKQHNRDKPEPGNSAKRLKPQIKYTVNVNEVNLKRELNKIQALIDRINGSSYELGAVVDDIVHLFKLTNSDFTYRKGSSLTGKMGKIDKMYYSQAADDSAGGTAEQKRMRKMLRSPIRIFFDKYARAPGGQPDTVVLSNRNSTTYEANNSEISTASLPEMKPLFDASSSIYTEPTDHELGFDVTSNGE